MRTCCRIDPLHCVEDEHYGNRLVYHLESWQGPHACAATGRVFGGRLVAAKNWLLYYEVICFWSPVCCCSLMKAWASHACQAGTSEVFYTMWGSLGHPSSSSSLGPAGLSAPSFTTALSVIWAFFFANHFGRSWAPLVCRTPIDDRGPVLAALDRIKALLVH